MTKQLTPEEIVKSFKDEFETKIKDARIEKHIAGTKKYELIHIETDKVKDFEYIMLRCYNNHPTVLKESLNFLPCDMYGPPFFFQ